MNIKDLAIKLFHVVFSRWKFLSLYLLFAGIALNGWYINVVGWFSGTDDYAATVKAQYGDINILNVIVFITGSVVFLGYLWADVKNKRLEKMIVGDINIKNQTLFGDANQAATTGFNSPAFNNSQAPVTINYGITEERSRAIFDEKLPVALKDYCAESVFVAKGRVYKLRSKLVPRIGEEENGFECFADPNFQLLLIEAQKAAASSDREADYDILSEMLATRAKMGSDRKLHLAVNKAVEMLPFISDEQLTGISVEFCLAIISPTHNSIEEALTKIDGCYEHIVGNVALPIGDDWLESLEASGMIKNVKSPYIKFKKSREIILKTWRRFTNTGIKVDSEQYQEALKILEENELPTFMIEHELNNEYARLYPIDVDGIDNVKLCKELEDGKKEVIMLSDNQKEALKRIFAMYEDAPAIKEDFQNRFIAKYNEYPNLRKVNEWWDKIPSFYELTVVGRVLASANAHKCDATIPLLIS